MPQVSAQKVTIDGNEAVAYIAHKTNEVIAIYPITPASAMGEHADAWSAQGKPNIFGSFPQIIEMQSEAGAAGAIHGALQAGTLATTFTASQGLLLMLPNMYKIAGELTPAVFHIAARSIAAQALSIFADHSDVMSARGTGFAIVASNSVQEAHDMALITQAASLLSRIPVLHFFDGFRTSHEVAKIDLIGDEIIDAMMDRDAIQQHRKRALSPDHPVIRGTSQNPDVFFQARETVNPYYDAFPEIMQQAMNDFADLTGRQYQLFDYEGAADAERVIVVMGSGAETVAETVISLESGGEKVGVLKPRLYRPFNGAALIAALPITTKAIAILDRTKEPGAEGEPLYKDVAAAVMEALCEGRLPFTAIPKIVGGRFGLSSKEFTPGMVCSIFDNLKNAKPKNQFTVGIHDDVGHHSLPWDDGEGLNANQDTIECLFYGLGSDGTVSANKNSIKIIGECTDLHAQGYFVYDSKKSGAVTVSHLRFGKQPIRSAYLIADKSAQYIGCHQTVFLEKYDMLKKAALNAVFVLNSALSEQQAWASLPRAVQSNIIEKKIRFYVIDAYAVAQRSGMEYFLSLPNINRTEVKESTMKGSMLLDTLFEFSGACSGCGETPYIKLASQLFGDRMLVANATGCSSIYGGNLPTTPWTKNAEGRGPAWNNSLFEDNAEFGLGIRAAYDQQRLIAEDCMLNLKERLDPALVSGILACKQESEADIYEQRERVEQLRAQIALIDEPSARQLESVLDALVKKSVWIIGGDGWAYDIGFGGLDHVLASGRDVNILGML